MRSSVTMRIIYDGLFKEALSRKFIFFNFLAVIFYSAPLILANRLLGQGRLNGIVEDGFRI